ncbi:hypothetical protein STRDD11_00889 [Streptococcus sp. DD11]|nr:hypothetical protein STRDD11_00889 [Streptococcus sp. DD11]
MLIILYFAADFKRFQYLCLSFQNLEKFRDWENWRKLPARYLVFDLSSFSFSFIPSLTGHPKGGGTDSHDGCALTHRGMDLLEDTV